MKQRLRSLISLIVFAFLVGIAFADTCTKTGPCSCQFPNGTGIDLTPSSLSSDFYHTNTFELKKADTTYYYELSTYHFNPCVNIIPKVNISSPKNECNAELSAYSEVYTLNANADNTSIFTSDKGQCNWIGNTNGTDFVSSAEGKVTLKLINGGSNTFVQLICSHSKSQLDVDSLGDPRNVMLSFYSPDACLKQLAEEGRSFGSTLLIIFFSVVIFYLVLGVLTRKFLMGATGLEVIPNLNFWTDLPNLVRDGWAFARNGFKLPSRGVGPAGSPDPNSYDSI